MFLALKQTNGRAPTYVRCWCWAIWAQRGGGSLALPPKAPAFHPGAQRDGNGGGNPAAGVRGGLLTLTGWLSEWDLAVWGFFCSIGKGLSWPQASQCPRGLLVVGTCPQSAATSLTSVTSKGTGVAGLGDGNSPASGWVLRAEGRPGGSKPRSHRGIAGCIQLGQAPCFGVFGVFWVRNVWQNAYDAIPGSSGKPELICNATAIADKLCVALFSSGCLEHPDQSQHFAF